MCCLTDFQGVVLYAYYGRLEDFADLKDLSIDLNGKIILVRAGEISFAEKVSVVWSK